MGGKGAARRNRPHIPAVLVTGIVTKTGRNMRDRMTPSGLPGNVCRGHTGWRATGDTHCDSARLAHNPEVAGSNPAPATSFRRSRPFPSRERAFCVSGTVVKHVAATALRAARQRDGGDGVTRDETAWTWWTLPSAISGCLARRYPRHWPYQPHDARWEVWFPFGRLLARCPETPRIHCAPMQAPGDG